MDEVPELDTAAMQRLAAGDDLALNEIMDRWKERICAFLLRMTADHAAAVDLTEETFVKLYHARSRYKPAGSFRSFLFSIAANLARNFRRWRARHPTVAMDDVQSLASEPADRGPTPAKSLERMEIVRAVQHAVQALPRELREAMILFTYHDLGYQEIAVIAGCSSKAVETRIHRARKMLAAALRDLAPLSTSL